MSDRKQSPDQPAEPVRISLEVPAGLVQAYDGLVKDGIYPSRESAMLHAMVDSWRHNRGSFHTVRIDLVDRGASPDEETEPATNAPGEAPEV
jgi:hypothetical protein